MKREYTGKVGNNELEKKYDIQKKVSYEWMHHEHWYSYRFNGKSRKVCCPSILVFSRIGRCKTKWKKGKKIN